jgi:Fe-Mn family superoxide dismutase
LIRNLVRSEVIVEMDPQNMYALPDLAYGFNTLAPVISEELLRLHHDKHHAAYVNGGNAILQRLDKARADNTDIDTKATYKELSFHIGGHVLHSLYWENLAPTGMGGGGKPSNSLARAIDAEYGSFERFKKLFAQTALSVEGSGWAALAMCPITKRPLIMQIEKHNVNVFPTVPLLLVLDVWEHAYYLDYKNDRAKFIEASWNIVNWTVATKRFEALTAKQASAY